MTEDEALPFVIGKPKNLAGMVYVKIPVTAAIVTIMFLGGSRHHPAACAVVGDLAMVISDKQLEENLDGALMASARDIMKGLTDERHKAKSSRFVNDGQFLLGLIHPMELYAVGLSAEGFLDDLDEDDEPTIYSSLNTWAIAASKFVDEREMLAIYEREGSA